MRVRVRVRVHLSGCILNGSGLKDIQPFQAGLGNGFQLLPCVWLEHNSPAALRKFEFNVPRYQETATSQGEWLGLHTIAQNKTASIHTEGRSRPSATCYSRKANHAHELAFTCFSLSA